jgi:hypothetical protein
MTNDTVVCRADVALSFFGGARVTTAKAPRRVRLGLVTTRLWSPPARAHGALS